MRGITCLMALLVASATLDAAAQERSPPRLVSPQGFAPHTTPADSPSPLHPTLAALARAVAGPGQHSAESYSTWDAQPPRRPLDVRLKHLLSTLDRNDAQRLAQSPVATAPAPGTALVDDRQVQPVAFQAPLMASEVTQPELEQTPVPLRSILDSRNPLRATRAMGDAVNPLR